MDADGAAVLAALRTHQVDLMIHGHTHRPAIHSVRQASGQRATRYVLGHWARYGWLLRATPAALHMERFVIDAAE